MKKFEMKNGNKGLFLTMVLVLTLIFCACESDDATVDGVTDDEADCSDASVFAINLDASDCTVAIEALLGETSQYEETEDGTTRSITMNSIADHLVGEFPNAGNPNTISVQSNSYTMTMAPELATRTTGTGGFVSGILFSGVGIEPQTAESFMTSDGDVNREWSFNALQSTLPLGLDCNNAHVQPTGQYHYHGRASAYIEHLGIDGTEMVKVGYAADGFPIYYKYAYDDDGVTIVAYESGYQLIEGERPGDGETAPDGCYDGTYFADYEYVNGVSDLDACNGKMGKTPESDNEYYYVITDNFPSVPICFSGTPDDSFRFGGDGM
ncbi:MAG: YHYH protein [Saonia sp.]